MCLNTYIAMDIVSIDWLETQQRSPTTKIFIMTNETYVEQITGLATSLP
jgi:hypothetical protein